MSLPYIFYILNSFVSANQLLLFRTKIGVDYLHHMEHAQQVVSKVTRRVKG